MNEIAPRPHNSGHYTIEACFVSQYEQHLRAVLGLPLGDASMKVAAAAMLNILGEADVRGGWEGVRFEGIGRNFLDMGRGDEWHQVKWRGECATGKEGLAC